MHIQNITLYEVRRTPHLIGALAECTNYKLGGTMQRDLENPTYTLKRQREMRAIIAWEGDTLLGWMLVLRGSTSFYDPGGMKQHRVHIYVPEDNRKKGVGGALVTVAIAWAKRHRKQIVVMPNGETQHFFSTFVGSPHYHMFRHGIDITTA